AWTSVPAGWAVDPPMRVSIYDKIAAIVSSCRCMKARKVIYDKIAMLTQDSAQREQEKIDNLQQTFPATEDTNDVNFSEVFH
ncbi:hypothetical protein A2U01_0030334, partial [Trifolium medium]|nr:hypothetical protein [Trifolium medium]